MAGLVLSLKCANKALMMKALAVLALLLLCVALVPDARAQDRRQNEPGQFDFYVLALSWSPSFCASASERGRSGRNMQMQCGGARPFSFVVHGLWPQYERGFPEYCQRPAPRVSRDVVSSMLDLMPAPGLIFNEWDKHGVCSGLSVRAYFETTRKALRALVGERRQGEGERAKEVEKQLGVAEGSLRSAVASLNVLEAMGQHRQLVILGDPTVMVPPLPSQLGP